MLKMTIDNEEVLSNNDISIKEEILSPSSTILNNVYPKSWELDKDYTSRFYYPKDYSKLNIQNFSIEPEEAGKTIQINGSATLTDVDTSKESRVLRLLGQTSQTGTPTPSSPIPINVVSGDNTIEIVGKNFANCNGMVNTTNNGITFTINKDTNNNVNSITINGTATNYNALCVGTSYRLPAGTYNLYGNGITDNIILQVLNETLTQQLGYVGKNDRQLVLNADTTIVLRIMVNANATISNVEYKPMIAKTSGSTYEPYIGKSYPISLGVENLFDKNNVETGKFYTASGTSLSTNWAIAQVEVKPNSNYYLSGNNYNNDSAKIVLLDSSKNIISDLGGYKNVHSITTNSNTSYIGLSIANYVNSSDLNTIQLEKGSKANSFSPYGTTPIELCKIGTYQDYIYKDNGSWYLHKEIGKVVLDENTSVESGTGYVAIGRFAINGYIGMAGTTSQPGAISTHFTSRFTTDNGSIFTSAVDKKINVINTAYSGNYAGFKTWLEETKPIVYYVLATPTNTLIEDTTLIEQLEALSS